MSSPDNYVPSNENWDSETLKCFEATLHTTSNLIGQKGQAIFIVLLYIHDIRSLTCDP